MHLSPPDCSCFCLATAATPLARWWWPLSSAPDNIHHHSMLLLCLWKPYLMNKCILMICPAPDTALRCCGSKQAADWLPSAAGNYLYLSILITWSCFIITTVLLNSDQEKKQLLHPKSIPTSQCYYCTLIFNNFEMFRMKTFEIKPQTGGVNA